MLVALDTGGMNNPAWPKRLTLEQRCLVLLVNAACLWSLNSSCTPSAKEGPKVLEIAELSIPIPSGYRSVSKEELGKRGDKAVDEVAATLEREGHSRIAIMRVPRSAKHDRTPPTREGCMRFAEEFATKNKKAVVRAGVLVEHSAEGLGRSCQFTVSWGNSEFTQTVAEDWGVLCIHPPGDGAACQQVAAGFRRAKP